MDITPELIEKAKLAKTAEELLKMAEEDGVMLTAEQAQRYFEQLNAPCAELDDDDLDNVAGGACGKKDKIYDGKSVMLVSACPGCSRYNAHTWYRNGEWILQCYHCPRIPMRSTNKEDLRPYFR